MYAAVTEVLKDNFFGPTTGGVYSPSVQYTLCQMGSGVVERVGAVNQAGAYTRLLFSSN